VTADRFGIGRNGLTNSRIRGDGRCCKRLGRGPQLPHLNLPLLMVDCKEIGER